VSPAFHDGLGILARVFGWAPSELWALPLDDLPLWLDQAEKVLRREAKGGSRGRTS